MKGGFGHLLFMAQKIQKKIKKDIYKGVGKWYNINWIILKQGVWYEYFSLYQAGPRLQ